MEFKSKWLVGSSNIIMSGFPKRSLQRATLVFCPPDNFPTSLLKSSEVNPKPLMTPSISLLYE